MWTQGRQGDSKSSVEPSREDDESIGYKTSNTYINFIKVINWKAIYFVYCSSI